MKQMSTYLKELKSCTVYSQTTMLKSKYKKITRRWDRRDQICGNIKEFKRLK